MNLSRAFMAVTLLMFAAASASAKDREGPFLLQFTNEVASTAGIGLLKDLPIPEGSVEIRIWIGFGVIEPDRMLRLQVNQESDVAGEVIVHFPSDTSYMKEYADEFLKDVMRSCTNLRKGKESSVCTATFNRAPDWNALYKKLVKLEIDILPDESELLEPETRVLDGIAMVVEVRNGSNYRAYEYSNPSFRSETQAKAASQIIRIVSDVFGQSDGT